MALYSVYKAPSYEPNVTGCQHQFRQIGLFEQVILEMACTAHSAGHLKNKCVNKPTIEKIMQAKWHRAYMIALEVLSLFLNGIMRFCLHIDYHMKHRLKCSQYCIRNAVGNHTEFILMLFLFHYVGTVQGNAIAAKIWSWVPYIFAYKSHFKVRKWA